jgi:hypothetical protein
MVSKRVLPSITHLIVYLLFFLAAPVVYAQGDEKISPMDSPPKSVWNQTRDSAHDFIPLRLACGSFDPLQKNADKPTGVASGEETAAGYHLVQFHGPILPEWRQAVQDTGAVILEYVPDFAYLIRATADQAAALSSLAQTRWTGAYKADYKISPSLKNTAPILSGEQNILINLFPGEDVEPVIRAITGAGGQILSQSSTKWKSTLNIVLPPDAETNELIDSFSRIQAIRWMEPAPKWELHNNVSTDVMGMRVPRNTHGLTGKSQVVCVCDTGLDKGFAGPDNLHPDFTDGRGGTRVQQIFDWSGYGPHDYNGHGTHVAGSVLGNGLESGSNPASGSYPATSFAGSAPEASLVFQAVADDSGNLVGLPDDLNPLFAQAWAAGARIHTNSWGSSQNSFYTSFSRNVDEFVWDHRDFLILFSAGNNGLDKNRDGVVDLFSLGPPGTAKNCMTVGASEGNRPDGSGWDTLFGAAWPLDYAAEPLFSDPVADNPQGMAAFSSRGPVLDGRFKPDIAAPGTNILSTKSSVATGRSWAPYNADYWWMGGTSMSCPLTAGASALVRQYLTQTIGLASPSASLIKAAMLNGAEDIAPGQFGVGPEQEIPYGPGPNNVSGWGRVNIADCVFPARPKSILYFDENSLDAVTTGITERYHFTVTDPNQPLKIHLVWSDYPGSPAAQGTLVNDLDFCLETPSGHTLYADNALQSAVKSMSIGEDMDAISHTDRRAVKFTPQAYPAVLDSVTFVPNNPENTAETLSISIHLADGPQGMPGTTLYSTDLDYVGAGSSPLVSIPVNAAVESGSFFVVLDKTNAADLGLLVDDDPSPERSFYWENSRWVRSVYTPLVSVGYHCQASDSGFDRVNNVLGATVETPDSGEYVVRVTGYNVPMGPQTYSLVAGGGIELESLLLNATAGTGGTIFPSGLTRVRKGDRLTVTITPDQDYTVHDVLVDGRSVGELSTYTFENFTQNATIEALFERHGSSGGGGGGGCLFNAGAKPDWTLLLLPGLALLLRLRKKQKA